MLLLKKNPRRWKITCQYDRHPNSILHYVSSLFFDFRMPDICYYVSSVANKTNEGVIQQHVCVLCEIENCKNSFRIDRGRGAVFSRFCRWGVGKKQKSDTIDYNRSIRVVFFKSHFLYRVEFVSLHRNC